MTDTPSSQPPGWYYAEGDPPGTQRYWDGAQWQGGPQAVPGAGGTATYAAGGSAPAETGERFVAFLIDAGIQVGLYVVVIILGAIADALGLLGLLGLVAFSLYNGIYLQGTTGQTIGKKQQGIKLVRTDNDQPVGMLMAFVRGLLQGILWSFCLIPGLIDTIMILTSDRNQRFSDGILSFEVRKA